MAYSCCHWRVTIKEPTAKENRCPRDTEGNGVIRYASDTTQNLSSDNSEKTLRQRKKTSEKKKLKINGNTDVNKVNGMISGIPDEESASSSRKGLAKVLLLSLRSMKMESSRKKEAVDAADEMVSTPDQSSWIIQEKQQCHT